MCVSRFAEVALGKYWEIMGEWGWSEGGLGGNMIPYAPAAPISLRNVCVVLQNLGLG